MFWNKLVLSYSDYFQDYSFDHVIIYHVFVKNLPQMFPEAKVTCDSLTFTNETEKQEILSFKKLEPDDG